MLTNIHLYQHLYSLHIIPYTLQANISYKTIHRTTTFIKQTNFTYTIQCLAHTYIYIHCNHSFASKCTVNHKMTSEQYLVKSFRIELQTAHQAKCVYECIVHFAQYNTKSGWPSG